ncbi:MAG: hypothetical protein F4Y04_06050 [Chloroflexi bacterium]|nr:hypothetical protein [Chloroflexota bacterium]
MTTPNGQHHDDPNGSSQQATSTVLALDGWGPVIAEPAANGSNGSDPAIAFEEPVLEPISHPRSDWREQVRSGWERASSGPNLDPQWIRLIAPLVAMAIAVIAALKLGEVYRQSRVAEPAPAPPSRVETLRRSIALAIDPSLTPCEPARPVWQRWLD